MSNINDFVIENGVLIKYTGADDAVVVPSGITKIEKRAFQNCNSIITVEIPDSVIEIGEAAFSNCSSLRCAKLGSAVTNINKWTFDGCASLETVALPLKLESIGVRAFHNCKALKAIELPEGLKKIEGSSFEHCEALVSAFIPDTVTSIGTWAFLCCNSLKEVKIGSGVISIECNAFGACSSLVEITIGDSVQKLGDRVFCECTSLEKITLPDSLLELGETPFKNCTALKKIILSNKSSLYENGAPWWKKNFDEKLLPIIALDNFDRNAKLTKYILKDAVQTLKILLEQNRYDLVLKMLEFSSKISLAYIDEMIKVSNEQCNAEAAALLLEYKNQKYPATKIEKIETVKAEKELGLRSLSVEDIKKLWSYRVDDDGYITLKAYKGNETVPTIPDKIGKSTVRRIANGAFEWNRTVEYIYIPQGIVAIGDNAFSSTASLRFVDLPETLVVVGKNPFEGSSLVENVPDLSNRRIDNADSAALIEYDYCRLDDFNSEWEYKLDKKNNTCRLETYIGDAIDVYVPDKFLGFTVTEIGAQCFNGSVSQKQSKCYRKIESIRLPQTIVKIGRAAFFECVKLSNINIPLGCEIGESAFKYCAKLADKKLIIFNDTLYSCVETGSSAYKISIPDGVKIIAEGAFENCHNLKEVKIPESVVSIGKNAFNYCTNLTKINIPASVQTIAKDAFSHCKLLKK